MSRALALILAVLMLAQAFVAGGLVVACTSSNGDVELEWALAVCCDRDAAVPGDPSETGSAHQADCSCRDELLTAPDASKPTPSTSSMLDSRSVLPASVTTTVELTGDNVVRMAGAVRPESSGPPRLSRPILILRC